MKAKKTSLLLDISFLFVLLLKVFSFGMRYFPVLDDYIQYGGYPLYKDLSYVYFDIGTVATRPFASLLDPTLWGGLYPHLWIALLAITLLLFSAAKLLSTVFERTGIFITPFLYALLLLCPVGFEGTYWISASSRVVVGMFFAGCAAFLLTEIIDGKKAFFVPYLLCMILSCGFYESVMVMSCILQLFVILSKVKSNKKRIAFLIVPALSGLGMLIYYKLAQNLGVIAVRSVSLSLGGLGVKLSEFLRQFADIFTVQSAKIIFAGFVEGLRLTFSSPSGFVLLLCILGLASLCAHFGKKLPFNVQVLPCILLGLALIFLPLLPNILTDVVWLTLRNITVCLIGLVLVSCGILSPVLKKAWVRSALIFLLVFLFSVGNICELDTYRRVSDTDNLLVNEICQQLDEEVLAGNKNTLVVLENEIISPQVCYYKDHVKSVFDSDWALTGAVRANLKNIKIKMITPVYSLDGVNTEGKQIIYLGGSHGK